MQSSTEFKDKIHNETESPEKLVQTYGMWNSTTNNEQELKWRSLILSELTAQPRLKPNESYENYYKRIYFDSYKAIYAVVSKINFDDPFSYKDYLINPKGSFWNVLAHFSTACKFGAEIPAKSLIEANKDLIE